MLNVLTTDGVGDRHTHTMALCTKMYMYGTYSGKVWRALNLANWLSVGISKVAI